MKTWLLHATIYRSLRSAQIPGQGASSHPAYDALVDQTAGLRERKKQATREALHRAALRLTGERGLDQVTVEAIADAVGVSRRTFSNYFSGKEEALLHGEQMRMRLLVEIVGARPAAETCWTALTAAAGEFITRVAAEYPGWRAEVCTIRAEPAVLARQLAVHAEMERDLAAELVRRMPATADADLRARLVAGGFLATRRVTLRRKIIRAVRTA